MKAKAGLTASQLVRVIATVVHLVANIVKRHARAIVTQELIAELCNAANIAIIDRKWPD